MRIPRDADHFRIDLEERPVLAGLAMTGQRPGTEPDDGDMTETTMGGAGGTDRFGQRTSRIVVGQRRRRTLDRRTVVVAQPLSAVDRGAVIEDAGLAVGNFGHLVDAEETACRFDRRYSGAPQAQ